jgi:16S rRNA (guanine527-N7)-methyltransferase
VDERLLGALAEARALGFLGPGPLEAHLASADSFASALGPIEGRALDLGSGGGVPGLLLADRYPSVTWTLLDQQRRRTSFLARIVTSLGWVARVAVIRASAELLAHDPEHRGTYDVVVARSFAAPPITAEIGAGFLAERGLLAVAEPPTPGAARWPATGLGSLGLSLHRAHPHVVVLARTGPVSPSVPRPWRELQRRPAWTVSRETGQT